MEMKSNNYNQISTLE